MITSSSDQTPKEFPKKDRKETGAKFSSVSISDLRRTNRHRVLSLIARLGPVGRLKLCDETGLTGAGISRISRELIDAGLIVEGIPVEKKGVVGRRQALLDINPGGAYVIGATLTANRRSVALADTTGKIIDHCEMDDLDVSRPEEAISALADAANAMIARSEVDRTRLVGVGVGLAVAVTPDPTQKDIMSSTALGWSNVPIARHFQDHLDVPVKVEARATAMLRAELRKSSALANLDVLLVNVGLGVGAAACFGGQISSAGSPGFGDVAHLSVSDSDVRCHCGRKGCLNAVGAGVTVIDGLNGWTQDTRPPFSDLSGALGEAIERAQEGDPAARTAFRDAGRMMGRGIDAIATIFAPDRIVLSGQTGRQSDYVGGIRDVFRERRVGATLSPAVPEVTIDISNASSAEASSRIALEEFVYSHHLDIEKLLAGRAGSG